MRPAYLTYVLKLPKYFGQTLAIVAKKDPGYIEWLAGLPLKKQGLRPGSNTGSPRLRWQS